MTRYVPTAEAARRLGVTPATLYAYVSRGVLSRQRDLDGRTSLFSVDELEALAGRGRRRAVPPPPPSVDVQITSAITELGEGGLAYRGHAVDALARTVTFEQAAELLWTGTLPGGPVQWPAPPPEVLAAARAAAAGAGPWIDGPLRLAAMVVAMAGQDPLRADRSPDAVAALGRRLVAGLARARVPEGRRVGRSTAEQVASQWTRRPSAELVQALDRALVLLADHELASSTLAVRVAASTWADPYAAVASGLGVASGPLHAAAGTHVLALLRRCEAEGVAQTVGEYLRDGRLLPGYGHKVYRGDDPRVAPLLEAVRALGGARWEVVTALLAVTDTRLTVRPNVDLALGALAFVTGTTADVGELFALARTAGWLAHAMEEYAAPPVRYRATARYTGPSGGAKSA